MATLIKTVDQLVIQTIVDRIVECVHPEKIILFGSHAYGRPHDDSDLDILVIMHSDLPRYKRAVPICSALAGMYVPKDIVVYTPQEVEAWANVPQAFITDVVNKGRVVYDKEQG